MVVWGSNAFISQHDLELYDGTPTLLITVLGNCQCSHLTLSLCVLGFLWKHVAVRDVSKWSARMRQPMEEVYGAEVFAKTWEAWVDGVAHFAKRPEGTEFVLLQTHYTRESEQSKTENHHK